MEEQKDGCVSGMEENRKRRGHERVLFGLLLLGWWVDVPRTSLLSVLSGSGSGSGSTFWDRRLR